MATLAFIPSEGNEDACGGGAGEVEDGREEEEEGASARLAGWLAGWLAAADVLSIIR